VLGILMLHAFPLDSGMWSRQVDGLSASVPVVPVDLPGFDGAPLAEPEGWMDKAADRAAAALNGTGIDRVVVCGLSMGGYVAFSFWRRHRDLVAGLVFANTRADADDEAARERRRGMAERLRAEGSGFLLESPPPLLSEQAPEALWDEVRTHIERQPPEAIARAALGMAARADSAADLAGIDVPVLVITADADTLIAPEISQRIADGIPGSKLAVITGAGHLSNLEAPDEFNRLVLEHVERCRAHDAAV
jgi:pimeloyl-ACP methyl ester carboxylesterase